MTRSAARADQYQGPIYAGFWKRVAAYLLDTVVIVIGTVLVSLVFYPFGKFESALWVSSFFLAWLYHASFESGSEQATFGKQTLGIKVVDLTGRRISFGRATARYFGRILSGVIFCIGYAMVGWTKHRQALHDMIAGCMVVNGAALEANVVTGNELPAAHGIRGWQIALIVVAASSPVVLGILAAIAIPQYQAYLERAKGSNGQALTQGSDAVAEAYFHGMAAADAVSEFYVSTRAMPFTLDYVDFKGPTADFWVSMDQQTRIITVTHLRDGWALRFTPTKGTSGLIWSCDSMRLTPAQLGSTCR